MFVFTSEKDECGAKIKVFQDYVKVTANKNYKPDLFTKTFS